MDPPLPALVAHLAGPNSDHVLRHAVTLLNSNLTGDNWALSTEDLVVTAITKRLAETSRAKALEFGGLHRRLQQNPAMTAATRRSILHVLLLLHRPGSAPPPGPFALPLLPPPPAPPAPPTGLMDPTGHLRAQLRHLAVADPAASGPGPGPSSTPYWSPDRERALLHDLIFTLQNVPGPLVRFDAMQPDTPAIIQLDAELPRGTRSLVLVVSEVGWLYGRLDCFLKTGATADSLLHQSLCAAVQTHLGEYFKLLALLQAELMVPGSEALSLRKLLAWLAEPRKRLLHLVLTLEAAHGLRGGALASKVHEFIAHGNPAIRALAADIFRRTFQPLLAMIVSWTTEGELQDPLGEFFVTEVRAVADDRVWGHKYALNHSMVPSFVPPDLADQILVIGKAINFVRVQCDDPQWAMEPAILAQVPREEAMAGGSTGPLLDALHRFVAAALGSVNRRLMHLLFVKFKLENHAHALKAYLLLAKGDFIQSLMDNLHETLGRRAPEVFRHTVLGILDSAVRGTHSATEWDVGPYLDVTLAPVDRRAAPDLMGWDIFGLEYKVPRPLDVVFNAEAMATYGKLFQFLWRIKRLENALAQIWRKHMTLGRIGAARGWGWRGAAPTQRLLLQCNALRSDMVHFVYDFQYYLMFEVLEVSWTDFDHKLRVAKSLDEVVAAHSLYLGTLQQAALMTPALAPVKAKLDGVLGVIAQFVTAQDFLFAALVRFADTDPGTDIESEMDVDSADGGSARSGRSTADRLQEEHTVRDALHRLTAHAQQYKDLFKDLLQTITAKSNQPSGAPSAFPEAPGGGGPKDLHPKDLEFLRCLGFRLDFNEFFLKPPPAPAIVSYPGASNPHVPPPQNAAPVYGPAAPVFSAPAPAPAAGFASYTLPAPLPAFPAPGGHVAATTPGDAAAAAAAGAHSTVPLHYGRTVSATTVRHLY